MIRPAVIRPSAIRPAVIRAAVIRAAARHGLDAPLNRAVLVLLAAASTGTPPDGSSLASGTGAAR